MCSDLLFADRLFGLADLDLTWLHQLRRPGRLGQPGGGGGPSDSGAGGGWTVG